MIKKILVPSFIISIISCSDKAPAVNNSDNLDAAPQMVYDTVAIDSFGPGATSEAVMAKINAVAIKKEQDSLAAIAKAEKEKLDKENAKKELEKDKEKSSDLKSGAEKASKPEEAQQKAP